MRGFSPMPRPTGVQWLRTIMPISDAFIDKVDDEGIISCTPRTHTIQ